jgi:hypothetical protein
MDKEFFGGIKLGIKQANLARTTKCRNLRLGMVKAGVEQSK